MSCPDAVDLMPQIQSIKSIKMEELSQVVESDDSESEVQYVLTAAKKDQPRYKPTNNNTSR